MLEWEGGNNCSEKVGGGRDFFFVLSVGSVVESLHFGFL